MRPIGQWCLALMLVLLSTAGLAAETPPPNLQAPVVAAQPTKKPGATQTPAARLDLSGLSLVGGDHAQMNDSVRIIVIMTMLSILPALVLSMTAFIRIIIVMSMIRHAFGMPETPPNQVLIALALFLTTFVMLPTLTKVNHDGLQPYLSGQVTIAEGLERSAAPMRDFMLRQVREKDLALMYTISHQPLPNSASEVSLFQLIPAFILNELRVSFQIGFVIMLPFLLIDLVVSSILLALGMLMVPPSTISLPLKVLMFVLIDGWSLVLQGVLASFK